MMLLLLLLCRSHLRPPSVLELLANVTGSSAERVLRARLSVTQHVKEKFMDLLLNNRN